MTAYEKYQLEWMMAHGYSIKDLFEAICQYAEDCAGEYAMEPELIEAWENDAGFGGAVWASYKEWKDAEGK